MTIESDFQEWLNATSIMFPINIETSTVCPLKCHQCQRVVAREKNNPYQLLQIQRLKTGEHLTVERFAKIAQHGDILSFCGQVSDPAYCVNFLEILEYASTLRGKRFYISHAATQKSLEWYQKAFEISTRFQSGLRWKMCLDGLPSNSFIYRENQNSDLMWEAIKLGKSMGVHVEWHYIIFAYNEAYIEEAKRLAKQEGVRLVFTISNRASEDPVYKPSSKYSMTTTKLRVYMDND
jgi:hypothetical protein